MRREYDAKLILSYLVRRVGYDSWSFALVDDSSKIISSVRFLVFMTTNKFRKFSSYVKISSSDSKNTNIFPIYSNMQFKPNASIEEIVEKMLMHKEDIIVHESWKKCKDKELFNSNIKYYINLFKKNDTFESLAIEATLQNS